MADQLTIPSVALAGGAIQMTVQQVANLLNLSADRVRKLADEWLNTGGKRGLPSRRCDGYGYRTFLDVDVEAYKEWRLRVQEERITHLTTWRGPVPAKRSQSTHE